MKNTFISLFAILLGLIIIAFPILGVIGTSSLIGLSILLVAIYLLVSGVSVIDYNKYESICSLFLGIIMLIVSIGIIFNPNLFAFLAEILLYLAGIFLIVVGLVTLINNRSNKYGFWIGIAGIVLGVIYIIIGSYVSDPIVLGTLIGIWLVITGILKFLDR